MFGKLAAQEPIAQIPYLVPIEIVYKFAHELRGRRGVRTNPVCLEFFEHLTPVAIRQGAPCRFPFGRPSVPIGSVRYAPNSRFHHAPVFARSEEDVK